MYRVEMYARVRRACRVEGMSTRKASRVFGVDRKTVRKMLSFPVPPGYRRSAPPRRPKLDPFTPIIDRMAAQRIDHHRALTDQQLTGPVQHQNRLLLGAFRRCKAHRRTRHCLTDRFRIRCVVLIRFDEETNVLRRNQLNFVPECLQLPSPIVRRGTGFHTDKTGWQSGEERQHLPAAQLPP